MEDKRIIELLTEVLIEMRALGAEVKEVKLRIEKVEETQERHSNILMRQEEHLVAVEMTVLQIAGRQEQQEDIPARVVKLEKEVFHKA